MEKAKQAFQIRKLRGDLLRQGMTLSEFAEKEGFERTLVSKVIYAYWGRSDRTPRGPITRAILARLREYVNGRRADQNEGGVEREKEP